MNRATRTRQHGTVEQSRAKMPVRAPRVHTEEKMVTLLVVPQRVLNEAIDHLAKVQADHGIDQKTWDAVYNEFMILATRVLSRNGRLHDL